MKPEGSLPQLYEFASGHYQQPPLPKTSLRSICLTSCSAQIVQSRRWLCACSVLYILFSSCQMTLFGYPEVLPSFFLSYKANVRV